MLSKCCSSTLSLGCICHCGDVVTGLVAGLEGDYTIEYQHPGGGIVTGTLSLDNGDPISFVSFFNESGLAVFKIKDPDDVYISGPGDEDCFSVDVSPCFEASTEAAEPPDPPTCQWLVDWIDAPRDICEVGDNGGVIGDAGDASSFAQHGNPGGKFTLEILATFVAAATVGSDTLTTVTFTIDDNAGNIVVAKITPGLGPQTVVDPGWNHTGVYSFGFVVDETDLGCSREGAFTVTYS
jgi:hypothetical protein